MAGGLISPGMADPSAHSALLVAIGAVPGAWLRFRLVNHFQPMVPRKHWATLAVNVGACFLLGLITALLHSCGGDQRISL